MNLFNCFQAVAFYTAAPLAAAWCFQNDYPVGGWVLSVATFIGYWILSFTVHEEASRK